MPTWPFNHRTTSPAVIPADSPDPALAANVLSMIVPAAGPTVRFHDGTALEPEDPPGDDMDLRMTVKEAPLRFDATLDWHGVLDDVDFNTAQEIINAWNVDNILAAPEGINPRQLDEWVRRTLTAVELLVAYLQGTWPDLPRMPMTATRPHDALVIAGGTGLAPVEEKLSGLIGGPPARVDLDRIADLFAVGSDHRPEIRREGGPGNGNGIVLVDWGDMGVDVALHDGTMTITAGANFLDPDPDTVGCLLSVCSRWNTDDSGAVAVMRQLPNSEDNV